MFLSLTIICVVAGAILAGVNMYTTGPIAATKAAALEAAIKAVTPAFDNKPTEEAYMAVTADGDSLKIYPAKQDGKFVGAAVESNTMKGFGGEIRVIVGFDTEGKLLNYSVLQHAETPGLGAKMQEWFRTDKNRQSVLGRNLSDGELKVTKDGGDVDAITASTITSRAFLNAVNRAYSAFSGADGLTGATTSSDTTMSNLKILMNGIITENPTFVLLLGMCPTLGTTSSAMNGMSMGLATMFVLICSNMVISALKNVIPDMVRIPGYIVVIATFVTVVQMCMEAFIPALYASLGLFIPLIVVNCIVLGRAEAFAAKNGVVASAFDGIGIGLGFTIALTLLGAIRELLGTGKLFNLTIMPEQFGSLIFVLAPGAFIALGFLIAIVNKLRKA